MWESGGVKPYPLHHEARLKARSNIMYIHTMQPHMYTFAHVFCVRGEYICVNAFPAPFNTHTPSLQSVHQSSCLPLTLINSDSQNSPLSFPFLSLHPSILLNLYTHFLSIYLPLFPLSLVLLDSHAMSTGDIEEIIVFLSHCFQTAGSSFLNDSIKTELGAGYNHRSDTIAFMWWFYVN